MMSPESQKDVLLERAFQLISRRGWESFSLSDLAEETEISLAEVYTFFPEKITLLTELMTQIDRKLLETWSKEMTSEPQKDRLMDLIWGRFDLLSPYKGGLRSFWATGLFEPCYVGKMGIRMLLSVQWMLEAAGYRLQGPLGNVKVKGMSLLYLAVFRQWLQEDTPGFPRTMASLDRMLTQAEIYL